MKSAKGVARSRISPPPLNALSSFTVEPAPARRTGTGSLLKCVGPETGLVDVATASGCTVSVVIWIRKAPQPSTAARRASAATMADADRRRDHREGFESPKLTVSLTLPAARPRLPRATPFGVGHTVRRPPKSGRDNVNNRNVFGVALLGRSVEAAICGGAAQQQRAGKVLRLAPDGRSYGYSTRGP